MITCSGKVVGRECSIVMWADKMRLQYVHKEYKSTKGRGRRETPLCWHICMQRNGSAHDSKKSDHQQP